MADSFVFIVDEDPLLAKNLAAALAEQAGLDTVICTSVGQLVDAARERAPDAVICALRLGRADGVALLQSLRAEDPELVGLLMTDVTDHDGEARALAAVGPLGHVRKPAALADLLPRLRVGLERRALIRALADQERALRAERAALAESTRQVESARAELVSTHSELATATERLVQAEQLAAVGRVVSGIAHELSRQLTLVGYAEAIKSRVAGDAELVEFADIIVNAQKRLTATVDEIRDFVRAEESGRPAGLDREPADVAAVIDEALALLAYDRDVRQRIVERRIEARPLCALHRQKFAQVVINLVSNAVQATEPGAVIRVALTCAHGPAISRRTPDDAEPARAEPGGDGGHVAVLEVSDPGVGMPPDVLARLGEPFFTTRGDRGSGLGVGICMRIVEEHGGRLTYRSEIGRGTTARVTVPLLDVATRRGEG